MHQIFIHICAFGNKNKGCIVTSGAAPASIIVVATMAPIL